MNFQHTSYFCPEIIANLGDTSLSIGCQLEVRLDRDGHPTAIVIPDLNSLRKLQQEINLQVSELDNKLDDSRK
jgi:hypothetical protein